MDCARRFTRAADAARLLNDALAPRLQAWMDAGSEPVVVRSATVLRAHPDSRMTLRYAIGCGQAQRTLIAKFYARDRTDVARLLADLGNNGFGPGHDRPSQEWPGREWPSHALRAPYPIAYLPEYCLLLTDEAAGVPARHALRHGHEDIGERTARWLATLQAAALPLPAAYMMRAPIGKAHRWAQRLCIALPQLAPQAQRLLAMLRDIQPPWPARPCLVHGDFSLSHLFVDDDTTTVIDWDSWRVGDCAEDAGRFMASLHHLYIRDPQRYGHAAQARRAFSQAYPTLFPAARPGLGFYEGLACLRTAARLHTDNAPHRVAQAQAMLEAGMAAVMQK